MPQLGVISYLMSHNLIPKGFKSNAESQAINIRKKLGLSTTVACPARSVARLYNTIVTPLQAFAEVVENNPYASFPSVDKVRGSVGLLTSQDCNFSALALIINDYRIIIYNGSHSLARQESDIMHELAHIICGHSGDCLQLSAEIGLREYNDQYEQEAKWFGSVLQIPERGLFKLAKGGYTTKQIATIYGASEEMATYRRRILAIDRRLSYLKK